MIVPVILAGGSGTRLWPLSRSMHPKQLLRLVNDRTMLQNTVHRLQGMPDVAAPMVLCNHDHRFMVAEQLREMGQPPGGIILEPVGRNTAPAAAVSAVMAMSSGADPLLLVLPADHHIENTQAFQQAIISGSALASRAYLFAFGIVPTAAETGYGYIRKGSPLAVDAVMIDRFVEKPDARTAQDYLSSGGYCWNSGMFLFRASRYLAELERFHPDMVAACREAVDRGRADLDFFRLDETAFSACPADSIDYAVMEKTDAGAMLMLDAGWNDVGSWEALWQIGEKDSRENVTQGDVLIHEVQNSYLNASNRLLAAVGIDNHVIVETADAVMISPRHRVQEVKHLVEKLKSGQREEATSHRRVYRPWGDIDRLVRDEQYTVNHIFIKPGGKMSLQQHHRRSEHWVVVRGPALITRDEEQFLLQANESTYMPPGVSHRLENPGTQTIEIIEIQSGEVIDESDVVRLDSVYGEMD